MVRRRFALCLLFLLSVVVRPAHSHELSEFEREVQERALEAFDLSLDPAPQAKIIEAIDVFVVEPFDERDPIPDFVNVLHVKSRDYVVKQELALHVGEAFDQGRADDSLRNLRSTLKFSLVLVATALGSAPDKLRVLVIVKDIWSLRLSWEAQIVNGRTVLKLNPTESNFLGTHTTVGGLYYLEPDRQTFGVTLFIPQVGPSNIGLVAMGGPILERYSLEPEGGFGYFQYFKPLTSRYDKWAWSTGMGWRNEVTRRYQGAGVRPFVVEHPDGSLEVIPEVYETDRLAGEYQLVRSFGTVNKTNLSVGMEADRRRYTTSDLTSASDAAREAFEREVVPTSDTRISPFVQLYAHDTAVHRLVNVQTLALQEDLALGHEVLLRLYPASAELGSSRSLMGVAWGAGYAVPMGTGIAAASGGATIELAKENQNDVLFNAALSLISPQLGPGRVHLSAVAYDRYRNYLNAPPLVIGGESRLRGYPYNQFQGEDLAALTVEFRSVPIELFGAHVGGVLFCDSGHAADSLEELSLKSSVGAGVRLLFPQFDRIVFRLDLGVPLVTGYGPPVGLGFAFGQAFTLPGILEPNVLSGVIPQ